MTAGGRGRRPAGSGTREAIVAAARRQFGELGYQRASLRSIAAEARVDPRLVRHFFGSKQELFGSVVELPFDPETTFDALMEPGERGLGRRVAEFLLTILDSPEGRKTVTGLIRAAASEEEAAATIRDLVARRLLLPLASRVGRDRPELRASLVASQIVGLAMARHVVGLTPLATASQAELIAALAPVFDHYLTGHLDPTQGVEGPAMGALMDELSAEELADRSGVTARRLGRLVELGIITPTPEGRYRRPDIERIRVVDALAEAGFAPEQLGQLIATGAYDLDWTGVVYPEPTARMATTLEQAAAATGLPEGLVGRLFDAWELPRPQPSQALRADDEELLRLATEVLAGFGHDETALLTAVRQVGDSLRRLAETQVRLFHAGVDRHFGAEGHPDQAWTDDLNQVAASLMASFERMVVLLYRRHFEHHVLDVTVLRAEAAMERAGLARRRPVRPPAIAFLDLAGYTRLTEEQGDRAAAELAARLVEIVHELAHRHGGRPVKLLGDGVMFHFPEPAHGLLCALELVDRAPRVGLPRARVGLDTGPVVFQNGDYFGRKVNVAARISDYAQPGAVLVSDAIVAASRGLPVVRYAPIGPVTLKGLTDPVSLYAVSPAD